MEINLFHAFFGRFAVLIPLLAFFFEIATIITQKPLLNKISGSLSIFASILVIIAGLSGFQEFWYLKSNFEDISLFNLHYISSSIITFGFLTILLTRIYLLKKENEKLAVAYMILFTVLVMANLFNNEFIVHTLREN